MTIEADIVTTSDGSHTLRHPLLGDTYHSVNGALTESLHIFIAGGFDRFAGRPSVNVLEVGMGSGLNALLTCRRAGQTGQYVQYTAIEKYPLADQTVSRLGYNDDAIFARIHDAPWGEYVAVTPWFTINKVHADLLDTPLNAIFDLVYYDAFAPQTQPELWTADIFSRIAGAMNPCSTLVTYSCKGTVKQALREAGFEVARLPGPPGKRHMLRAVKK